MDGSGQWPMETSVGNRFMEETIKEGDPEQRVKNAI